MSDDIKLSGVGVDCPDAGELAAFYAEITGGTVTSQNERGASMSGPGGTIPTSDHVGTFAGTVPRPCHSRLIPFDWGAGARRNQDAPQSDRR